MTQASRNEHGEAPQTLRLRDPLPRPGTPVLVELQLKLELPLKCTVKDGVVLGGAQQAVDNGDESDMSFHGSEVPKLILVQPFGLAFLVIDFHGPPMTVDAGDACGLPRQAIRDQAHRRVGQIGLAMVDHETESPEVLQSMRFTITEAVFQLTLKANADRSKHLRRARPLKRREMFLLESVRKLCDGLGSALEDHALIRRQRTHIGPVQGLIQILTEAGPSEPTIERHRQLQVGMRRSPRVQQLLANVQFTVIQRREFGMLFLAAPPHAQHLRPPFVRRISLERLFRVFQRDRRRAQTLLERVQVDRLP